MKRLLVAAAMLISLSASAQKQDCDNYLSLTASYIIPKSVSVGADYFAKHGLTAGISGAIDVNPATTITRQGANEYQTIGNKLDLYVHVGYRVFRIDYTVSVFTNIGYTMGDVNDASLTGSVKVLFPINTNSISFEPMYIKERGWSGKLSFHLRL